MSDGSIPPQPPPVPPLPPRPTPPRDGCLTAIMVIVGIFLLLPGLCALLFGGAAITGGHFPSDVVSFFIVGLLAGAVGVGLIVAAIRGRL